MNTVLEPGWFREGGVWLKDHLSDGWEESSGAKTGQPLTKNKRAWIIMKSSVKACWGSEFEFWPISGGREKARWGNQLLEANQPAAESPAGGDNITEKIETPKRSKILVNQFSSYLYLYCYIKFIMFSEYINTGFNSSCFWWVWGVYYKITHKTLIL